MQNYFQNLVQLLSHLPGVGQRSASRIAFFLLKAESNFCGELGLAIQNLQKNLFFCKVCGSLTDQNNGEMCEICLDPKRERQQLCVVEEPGDVIVIEKTGAFQGLYHVLMGALSPLDGISPNDLRVKELLNRLEESRVGVDRGDASYIEDTNKKIQEIFIATNPTLEGDATADYICRRIEELGRKNEVKITRISHGIPTGSAIEYAETNVLARSIRSRIEY